MTGIILTSSVLILVIALLRQLLRGRIDPRIQYALWLLAALRLLIPGFLFAAPVSVLGATEELQSAITAAFPKEPDNPLSPDAPVSALPEPAQGQGDAVVTSSPPVSAAHVTVLRINWLDVIWKVGAAAVGAALLLSNAAFSFRLRRRRSRIPAEELPSPCQTPVYKVEGLASPCLFGFLRPAIYLNEAALTPERLEHILVHEQTHLRHGDHLWAVLRSVCLAVHWYNPLVWWAAVLSRRDCELACDAGTIARLGESRRLDYGQTLVSMVISRNSPADLLRASTTMTAGKRTMAERIRLIAKRPRMLKITLAAVALAVCGVVLITFGGTKQADAGPLPEGGASDGQAVDDSGSSSGSQPLPDSPYVYTHSSGLFSLTLPENWAEDVVFQETEDGVNLFEANTYAQAQYGWLMAVHPQPVSWVEANQSPQMFLLDSFDTNGTPYQYILEYRLSTDFTHEPAAEPYREQFQALLDQRQAAADGFRLLTTPELVSQLIHDNYQSDMALSIAYLPYLSWESYKSAYNESEMLFLLTSLWSFADAGKASWEQVHDILSVPTDSAIDGAYATAYQDIFWALYQRNPQQFSSVLGSIYISDAERDNVFHWLRYPLSEAAGRDVDDLLTDLEMYKQLGLPTAAAIPSTASPAPQPDGKGEETAAGPVSTGEQPDGEIINGIMRAWSPSVLSLGSPEILEAELSGEWSIQSIQSALREALSAYLSDTLLDDSLSGVSVSYSFQFPDDLHDGVVLTVPYTASYSGAPRLLPSGTSFTPRATTNELTARVHLVGDGVAVPADEDFQAGQAVYQLLASCVQMPDMEAVSGGEAFDALPYIQSLIEANLAAAGLSGRYQISSIASGGYTQPNQLSPGESETIDFTVRFTPLAEGDISVVPISSQLTIRVVE